MKHCCVMVGKNNESLNPRHLINVRVVSMLHNFCFFEANFFHIKPGSEVNFLLSLVNSVLCCPGGTRNRCKGILMS